MKHYFYLLVLLLCFTTSGFSQVGAMNGSNSSTHSIEDLNIYPNPVSNGKIYITTKHNFTKEVEIFDVLGKKIHSASLFGKELDVSELTPGIYILKIKEKNNSATRKLVIR